MPAHARHAKPATALQIARYGAVAAAFREIMAKRGWESPSRINEAMGKPPSYSSAFQWVNAKGAPNHETAKKLAKLFSVPAESLLRRETNGEARLPVVIDGQQQAPISRRIAEVLSFVALSNGDVHIRLDVTLPVDHAMPLFRTLLDAGLVAGVNGGAAE